MISKEGRVGARGRQKGNGLATKGVDAREQRHVHLPTPMHFHAPHTTPFKSLMSNTHAGGGDEMFLQNRFRLKSVFSTAPPSMPNYRKFPPPPPVLFIKVFPMPTSSPGLVLVSVKKMVGPPNFFFPSHVKAKKMNAGVGPVFFFNH
jgi:hypothetical protein